jgi:DNA-binding NarL/FixJ family response regulator
VHQEEIRVLIADDHALFREGVRRLLEDSDIARVIGEAADGTMAVRLALELKPDVVLMDVSMPGMNGIEATRRILEAMPAARVLILTIHDNDRYIQQILHAGAAGYLLKDTPCDDFLSAILAVHRGDSYLSPVVSRKVLEGLARHRRPGDEGRGIAALSPREREVLVLLAEGKPNREVAELLGISPKTVEAHRANIMKKLEVHSIVQLVRCAIQEGLVVL